MDAGASPAAGRLDQELAAVGAVNRAPKRSRKGASSRNAWKGGSRPAVRQLARLLRDGGAMVG